MSIQKKDDDNEHEYDDIPLDEILAEIKNTPYLNKIYIDEIPLTVRTFLETKYSVFTGKISVKFRISTLQKLDRKKTNELIRILRVATSMYEIKNMIKHNETLQKINSLLEEIKPNIASEELYRTHRDVSDYSIIAHKPLPYSPVLRPHFDAGIKKVAAALPSFNKKAHDYASEVKSSIINMKKSVVPSEEANELYKLHASSDYSTLPAKNLGGNKNLRGKKKSRRKNNKSKSNKSRRKSKKM
jgi:hypothetical protein